MWGAWPRLGSSWAFMQRPLQTRPHISTVFVAPRNSDEGASHEETTAKAQGTGKVELGGSPSHSIPLLP